MRKVSDWSPTQHQTGCCNEWIWSRFPGEFRKCTCGFSAIDQTEYYARFNGHFNGKTRSGNVDGEERGIS